jgi:hypothetical protein
VVPFRRETVRTALSTNSGNKVFIKSTLVCRKILTIFIRHDSGIFITELVIKCFLHAVRCSLTEWVDEGPEISMG